MGDLWKLVLALALWSASMTFGCGGGDGEGGAETAAEERLHPEVTGPAREFLSPEGDNVAPSFGREATRDERDQASQTIEAWLRARAVTDWKEDCSYFSRRYVRALVAEDATRVTNGRVKTCPQALAYFGSDASGDCKNTMSGPIDSLRVGEGVGYALYHGSDGRDWTVPVEKEEGRWLVSISTPIERK